ncbi:hypothetical protein BGZ73_002740 [Actinomortierella ambigua]|nr:hypothetical protein BGZ73_002740 [Actinomortierella ambigua]
MTENNPYPVGTTVFAKLKGYPWWPARIEADEKLPDIVKSKRPKQRPIWPVFFYGSYDYGWFGLSELKEFDPVVAEKSRKGHRQGSALEVALREALNPRLLEEVFAANAQDDDEEEEDYSEEEVKPKKKATKAKKADKQKARADTAAKKRRASTSEEVVDKRKPTKRAVPVDEDDEEPEEVPKAKKRASVQARPRDESDKKSVEEEITVPEATAPLSRTRRSEDDATDAGDQARAKKRIRGQPNERLLKLRHKLQKLLLVKGLSDDALTQNLERAHPILEEVERFEIDLKMLKETKIGRLMKKISDLQFSSDVHHIVERSLKLIKKYKAMMEKAQEAGEIGSPATKSIEASATPSETVPAGSEQPIAASSSSTSSSTEAPKIEADSTLVAAVVTTTATTTTITAVEATPAAPVATEALSNGAVTASDAATGKLVPDVHSGGVSSNDLHSTAPAPEAVVAAVAAMVGSENSVPATSTTITEASTTEAPHLKAEVAAVDSNLA